MRQRRDFLIAAAALAAAPLTGSAQAPARIARIGFLSLDRAGNPRGDAAFLQGLREHGYVDGRNIVIEYRDARRQFDRFPALAAELVALKVDVIVAPSVLGAQAARRATTTIPIVFAGIADPIRDGLVASLAQPGGNATGLSNLAPELVGKRIELLKEAVPGLGRVAILWQPGSGMERTDRDTLKDAGNAARALGLQLTAVEAKGPAELDRAFADIAQARAGALVVLGSPALFTERERIISLALRHRLPMMCPSRQYVVAGGLMAYGASLDDLLRRCAGYVDKLLKGAKAADLPVEQPTKFELIVNLGTAKALGITLAPGLLARADEVIQ